MRKEVYLILIVILILFRHHMLAQTPELDSLNIVLKNAKHDTMRIKLLSQLAELCEVKDILKYTEPCIKLATKNLALTQPALLRYFYLKYLGASFNNTGFFYYQEGIADSGLYYYNKSLQIQEQIKDKSGMAMSLINIGQIYQNRGDIPKTLDYYHQSLKISEEINDKANIANSLNNIAAIYSRQGDIDKALNSHYKALKIREELKDKRGVAESLNNIGFIYYHHGDPSCTSSMEECRYVGYIKALDYYLRTLKIRKEIKDKLGIANSLNNLGTIYDRHGDVLCKDNDKKCLSASLDTALSYYSEALTIQEEINNKMGKSLCLGNISLVWSKRGQLALALNFAKKSIQTALELGYPMEIKYAASALKEIYYKQGNYAESLKMYEFEIKMRDSISNETNRKASIKKQFQIEYEREAVKDSVANVAKMNEEQLKHDQAITQQRTYTYGGGIGFMLMLVVAGVSFKAFKSKQKVNIIITEQKLIAENQKHIIEEKQKEIIDSINYARRIQRAHLPSERYMTRKIKELKK